MQKNFKISDNRGLMLSVFVIGLAAVLFIAPNLFRSEAGNSGKGLIVRTESHVPGLENYDIRNDKAAFEIKDRFRQQTGKDASSIADVRDSFVRGEDELRTRIPTLKVDYSTDLRIPQVITPDVWKTEIARLTSPSTEKRSEILRNFIRQNTSLIGVSDNQVNDLIVTADYTNPNGYLSFAHLEQRINGVPVYQSEIKAGFTKSGEMIRVINSLVPGLDYESMSGDFRDPLDAVRKAFGYVNAEPNRLDLARNDAASTDLKVVFGNGDWATTAEKFYFPTEVGVARPAWRVLVWQPVNAFYVLVDAETGALLSRDNITADQTQSATYQVYTNSNGYINSAENPAPLTPGPITPAAGTQGTNLTRSNVTLIGNETPNPGQNNLGWITDGANITDGNNVEAGIDRDGTNGVDAPQTGSPNRTFTSTWNPPPGNPAPGDSPLDAQAQRGAVIQMFYVMNLYHDQLYSLGFTEAARNFQNDNFGRGGVAGDRISAEGQDSSGTNNANFSITADGTRGRMQMYIWTGPTPDYDGTADADIIIHEVTHGTSGRLHNNALGNQGSMMGEGWGDWYGHTMLAEPTDPINGIYTTGGYATYLLGSGFNSNYYYGIRRFPKAVIGFTGGPNNRPHNPLTFKHINADCDTTLGTTTTAVSSAFPRSPVIATSGSCSQVHNAGEIWSSALWEVRAKMVTRLGFTAGTRRVLQVVTDGMKLAPPNPMFLQERDAIIAAASALPVTPEASADVADVREGFRLRGMGFSASTQSATAVTEAFDFPNVQVTNPISVSDAAGYNDGYPEPGENVTISVSIRNTTGSAVSGVQVNVNGGTNVNVGTINDGQTVVAQVPYLVPANAVCGSLHQITINVSSSVGSQTPTTFEFRLGVPVGGANQTFTSSVPVRIPGGTATIGVADVYPTTLNVTGLTGNKTITLELTNLNTTYPGDMDWLLVGPGGQKFIVMSDVVSAFSTQNNAVVKLKDSAAANLPDGALANMTGEWKPTDITSGDAFAAPAPSGPYSSPAPVGTATFASVFGTAGSALNGTWNLYGVDDVSGDFASIGGWKLTFEANDYACQVGPPVASVKSRADFDGDGKTDLSVFRPLNGGWYIQGTQSGFRGITWGGAGDTIVPGDYDGDGKADTAIFRASNIAGVADFYILNSNGFTMSGYEWGSTGDVPVVGDYDGDGKADVAVYRPSTGTWYYVKSTGGATVTAYGQAGDVPVVGDFDGDGKGDLTVYRSGAFISQLSGGGTQTRTVGTSGDILVPADYDGDNKDDAAIFRPSTGQWIYIASNGGATNTLAFGLSGDVPVPGDYDGDGKDDQGVYRNGTWYVNRSQAGFFAAPFGSSNPSAQDTPAPRAYIP